VTLPTDRKARKDMPVASGVLDYFPDAIAAVAHCSKVGNDQHNPGQRMHWNRALSQDESDALLRHFMERGTLDSDGVRHSAKVAWRALALLQKEIENELESSAGTDSEGSSADSGRTGNDQSGSKHASSFRSSGSPPGVSWHCPKCGESTLPCKCPSF